MYYSNHLATIAAQIPAARILGTLQMDAFVVGIMLVLAISYDGAQAQFRCLSSCNASSSLLGTDQTVGDCCGPTGRNGGGYDVLADPSIPCESCDDYRIIQADVSITVDPEVIIVGQDFTANCNVTTELASSTGQVTWQSSNGTVLAVGTPNVPLPLRFQPFTAEDFGDYFCSATLSSSGTPQVTSFVQSFFRVAGSPLISAATIQQDQDPVAGESYTLTCTVNQAADIDWVGPDGLEIVNGSGIAVGELQMVGPGLTTRTLTFSALALENSGRYTCRNDVNDITRVVSVAAPQPAGVISTPPSGPVAGQPFPAECTGTVPASLNGIVKVAWIAPNGTTLATNSSLEEATVSLPLTSLELSDSGVYVCQITILSPFLGLPLTTSTSLAITAEIGECGTGTSPCSSNASCVDLPEGGFQCICNSGFTGDGQTCTDINECTLGGANCDPNAECRNIAGSFECVCRQGYAGNGTICTDIDECALGLDNCDQRSIHLMASNSDSCRQLATCSNTSGGFQCSFNEGLIGNGVSCFDVDECSLQLDNCHPDACCRNTPGSFNCTCRRGYLGDGVNCCIRADMIGLGSDGTRTRTRRKPSRTRSSRRDDTDEIGTRRQSTEATCLTDEDDDTRMTNDKTARTKASRRKDTRTKGKSTGTKGTRTTDSTTVRTTRPVTPPSDCAALMELLNKEQTKTTKHRHRSRSYS